VAIVPEAGCTYPELLFQHKNLDYFQENNEDKKVTQVSGNRNTRKAVMLPSGSLELPTALCSFKTFKCVIFSN